ncbi:MAG: serine/threonine-protein kinase [Polyangiales bacterium]
MSESSASPKPAAFDRVWQTLGYSEASSIELEATIRPDETKSPSSEHRALSLPAMTVGDATSAASELTVTARLGSGGMGAVDLAVQRSLGREVAVKRLLEGVDEPAHAAALVHEARVLGRLEHPGIVPVYALGADAASRPVVVMKRVSGVSLTTLVDDRAHPLWATLSRDGREPIEVFVDVMMQVCNALAFAHARSVIHRDLKPDNVMIGEFGVVYVLDWGVALDRSALTPETAEQRQIVGTPMFMAPELFDGPLRTHDERTDVYLFGAMLHYVLTGRARHEGATLYEALARAYLSEPFAYDSTVPEELGALCNDCVRREPELRPASIEIVRKRLVDYLHHRGSAAIARRAIASLARARALANDELDQRRTLTEARLAFAQALADWPENPQAKRGLRDTLSAIIEREVESKNATAARAAANEMGELPSELAAKITALEAAIERERAHAEAGRAHAREMDASVGANVRAALGVVGFVVLLASSALFVVLAPSGEREAHAMVLAQDVASIAFFLLAVTVLRRRLLANTISRRLTGSLGALLACGAAIDGLAWILRSNVLAMASFKFAAVGFVLLSTAITVEPWLAIAAALAISSSVVMARWPSTVEQLGSAVSIAMLAIFVWVARRAARRAGDDQPATITGQRS